MLTALTPALLQSPTQVPTGLSAAADVAMIVVGASILVVSVFVVAMILRLNKRLNAVSKTLTQSLGPVSDRARSISDNVDFITQALRTDVERLNASVRALTDRLHQASDHMEERIVEFNALMEVVQGEAEGIFIETAAVVRGVRESARVIASPSPIADDIAEPDDSAEEPESEPGAVAAGEG